jgi:type II secretory pathway component GspD/PulD (secretin)
MGVRKRPVVVLLLVALLCVAGWPAVCRAAADAAAKGAKPADAAPAAPALEVTLSDRGLTIYAEGVQADEVFGKLARVAGVGILVDDSVGRREGDKFVSRVLTISLANKSIDDIISSVCTTYGLSHSHLGNVYMISEGIPKNPSSYLMSDIDSVTTEYVLSSEAKSLLPEFLQAHVKVNDGKNAVVFSAPPEVLAKFREDIKQFDVPASQIMIEVLMVEFSETAAHERGFDQLWANAGRSVSTSSGAGEVLYHVVNTLPNEFAAALRALEEKGGARVHANPRIATVSGQKASIFVGQQRYLRETVQLPDYSTLNFIDAGIKLDMTPWTGGGGEIISDIAAEVSVMSAPDPITKLPEKSTRRVTTQVRVRQGETIIIGGLTQREMQSTRTKIPLLGDLPVLGSLFRSESKSETNTELVIFITPRVLADDSHLSEAQVKGLLERSGAPPQQSVR